MAHHDHSHPGANAQHHPGANAQHHPGANAQHHPGANAQRERQKAVAHRAARRSTWIALGVLVLFFAAPKVLGTLIGIAIVLAVLGLPVYALWRFISRVRTEERRRSESAALAAQQARAMRIDALERELGIGWYGIGRDHPLEVPQRPDV